MMTKAPIAVVATNDVHSHLEHAGDFIAGLAAAGRRALVVDSGDFFEGTGYYVLGEGAVESMILLSYYDVIAPGNHGFAHYLNEPALREKTVCANVADGAGHLVFRRSMEFEIAGRPVIVSSVLGRSAFASIPIGERAGLQLVDPASALQSVAEQHRADGSPITLLVLSHSGWISDLELARQCPFIDVIFSGHCHSPHHSPVSVGSVSIVKGREYAEGYAEICAAERGWQVRTARFSDSCDVATPQISGIMDAISSLTSRLAEPRGVVAAQFRNTVPNRSVLLRCVASEILASGHAESVLFNETVLRPLRLSAQFTLGDLLEVCPFETRLVVVKMRDDDVAKLPGELANVVGPLVTESHRHHHARAGVIRLATTDYLARTHLQAGVVVDVGDLAQFVTHVLTDEPDREEDNA